MRAVIINIFSQVVFLGCSTTHLIKSGEDFILIKKARLVLSDERKVDVNKFQVIKDSIIVQTIRAGDERRFHTSEMNKLIVKYRGKGALWGAVSFGFGGAVIGAVFHPADVIPFVEGKAGAYEVGVFAGAIGIIAGILNGKKDIYIFEKEKDLQTLNDYSNLNYSSKSKTIPETEIPERAK